MSKPIKTCLYCDRKMERKEWKGANTWLVPGGKSPYNNVMWFCSIECFKNYLLKYYDMLIEEKLHVKTWTWPLKHEGEVTFTRYRSKK